MPASSQLVHIALSSGNPLSDSDGCQPRLSSRFASVRIEEQAFLTSLIEVKHLAD
jgi:hypothetical protein